MSEAVGSSKPVEPTYKIRETKKDGHIMQGMFAARTIRPGDVIIKEKALIAVGTAVDDVGVYDSYADLVEADQARIRALTSHANSAKLYGLAKIAGQEGNKECGTVMAILNNNFLVDSGNSWRYLCTAISRINHSCKPNALYDECGSDMVEVKAVGEIAKGSEILIAYVPMIWSKTKRAEKLFRHWGIKKCDCEACMGEELLSDKLRKDLDECYDNLMKIRRPALDKGQPQDKVDRVQPEKQMDLCKFHIERTIGIKALSRDTLNWLKVYLPLLERNKLLGSSEAKKWFPEGERLARICPGHQGDFVEYCANMLKQMQRGDRV